MKYIDLSHKIKNDMPVYPGDEEVSLNRKKKYEDDGYNLYVFEGGMHAGTHIDAPLHFKNEKGYISEYPIERFIGNVALLDVRGEKIIGVKDEYYKNIKENDIVLLFTGWDNFYGTDKYYNEHPIISEEFTNFVVRKKIKILGVDMPSPDKEPYEMHKKLFENDIFILENLTNLKHLLYNENIQIFAQPLNLEAEASLVRPVAFFQGY